MKKVHLFSIALSMAFIACKEKPKSNTQETTTTPVEIVDEHTAEKALDWNGTYTGTLPCNDCPGILTTIKLNNDKTYEKTETRLKSEEKAVTENGTFSFTEKGNNIVLTSKNGSSTFAVGENRLNLIDKDGNSVQSHQLVKQK